MSYTPEQLRQWAEFVAWDEPDYRKPSVSDIRNQLDAHADALEERQELIAALRGLSEMYVHSWDLVSGGLVMLGDSLPKFERAHETARALLARLDK